jgi:adenosylhomocysteine nucleosidase
MSGTVIIAAMEREVQSLVKGWRQGSISAGQRSFRTFEQGDCLLVISGIGRQHAEAAARAAVEQFRPAHIISAGVAGALIRSLKAGSVVTPNVVVDAVDGAEYRCSVEPGGVIGGGVLVSADEIAGSQAKQQLVERFHGLVVDMEAAGVAKIAKDAGIGFRCAKAISDEVDFVLPPLNRFVDENGNFRSAAFAGWATLRPWQWARVIALAQNTNKAARNLCDWLEKNLAAARIAASIVTLGRAEFRDVAPGRQQTQ